MTEASIYWAIAYHANSKSPRARKWYYVARMVDDRGKLYCIGRADLTFRQNSLAEARETALREGFKLVAGLFTEAPSPRIGPEMVRVR